MCEVVSIDQTALHYRTGWQPDGRFQAEQNDRPHQGEAAPDDAIKELRQAVDGGCDMPWSMVGISWATAKRLLEMVEGSDAGQS